MPPEGLLYRDLFAGRGLDLPRMMAEMRARMAAEGLPFAADRERTWNTRLAQELAVWATERGTPLDDALFRAVFADGRNVGDIEVLVAVAEAAGLPGDEARAVLAERRYRARVDADWARARALGVSGVPTYVVTEPSGQLRGVVGAQPYEVLAALAERAGAVRR